MYNTTNLSNATNLLQYYVALDTLSSGFITISILITLYLVAFITFRKYEVDTMKVFTFVSSAMGLISVLLWAAGIISFNIVIYPVILMVLSIILFMVNSK